MHLDPHTIIILTLTLLSVFNCGLGVVMNEILDKKFKRKTNQIYFDFQHKLDKYDRSKNNTKFVTIDFNHKEKMDENEGKKKKLVYEAVVETLINHTNPHK